MSDFITNRFSEIASSSWQHIGRVVPCVVLAAFIAVALAALVRRSGTTALPASGVSAVGPAVLLLALIAPLLTPFGFGATLVAIAATVFPAPALVRNAAAEPWRRGASR